MGIFISRAKPIILIDAMNTIFDWDERCHQLLCAIEKFKNTPKPERKNRHIKDNYSPELQKYIKNIYQSERFIRNIPLIKGAYEALEEILKCEKYEPFICSKPYYGNDYYEIQMPRLIEDKLSSKWRRRTIVAPDKTIIKGKILIDDNMEIKGMEQAEWIHIFFNQPWNEDKKGPRLDWSNWKEVLDKEIEKIRLNEINKSRGLI